MDGMTDRPRDGDQQSQLAELLACERDLDRLLATAREEARRTVEDARAAATQAEADAEGTLAAEVERLRSTIEGQARSRVQEILARSRERAARFDGISDERVKDLADAAFRQLISHDGQP